MICGPDCASAAQTIALALCALGAGLWIGRTALSDWQAVVAGLAAYVAAAVLLAWGPS